jgi:hypothetical protein
LRIVVPLGLCTRNHLFSIFLNVLKLTGALVLGAADPRVDGYLGLGVLPRLDSLHGLVLLSSVDVKVVVEGAGFSDLLSTVNSPVQATCELVGDLDSEGPRGDGEHGLGGQLLLVGLPSWVLLDMLRINVLLVVPGLLVGGLDLDSEGPCVDGEFGLGVWRRLDGLHS